MKKTSAEPPPVSHQATRVLLALGGVLGAGLLVAASLGAVTIPLSSLLSGALSEQQTDVLVAIRLPRLVLACLVGAALAVSGAAMQGLFRNPLADPGLIGIASGAALAVALVIVLVGPMAGLLGLYSVSLAAFGGSLATCFLIAWFAQRTGVFSVAYLLLAGIAVNALAVAGTGFLIFISDEQQLRTLTFWTLGSLGGALWPAVLVAASIIVPIAALMLRDARALNILLLGEEDARYLGVDSRRLQRRVIVCTALAVGAAVAVSGIIGFVGLVVPHLVRLTIGPDHRLLMPASIFLGAVLLLAADTVARLAAAPAEIPVGILTSLIGGPFFLWLLVKQYGGKFSL
ncbi:MAG: iron ABC transporter permease [Hyphomicrobiales bacterium]|nr:iron ABC transporter permease [Hyphomicrobiales bacterium]